MRQQLIKRTLVLAAALPLATALLAVVAESDERDGGLRSTDPLPAGGLTRGQMADLYPALAGVSFQPPACVDGCVSRWGAHDMVGNVRELVADWVPFSLTCPGWGSFSDDRLCLSGADTFVPSPGSLVRGGFWLSAADAVPFDVSGFAEPSDPEFSVGFRGAR